MTYYYPQVSGGYRWNLIQRCKDEVGVLPNSTCDMNDMTCLTFDQDLTEQQKTLLDALMNDNPTCPPSNSGTILTIQDLWERFEDFKESSGVELKLFYSESIPGSGNVDQIEIHSQTTLTQEQINQVKTAYSNLIQ